MEINKSLYSPVFMPTERIISQIFEVLPDKGPLLIIMDTKGNSRPSDPEEFSRLDISESFLKEVCIAIDDGVEPVIARSNGCSFIAGQLATEENNYGYVFVVLPQNNPESTLEQFDLIEMLLNQIGLTAELIEKSSLPYEVQQQHFHIFGRIEAALN